VSSSISIIGVIFDLFFFFLHMNLKINFMYFEGILYFLDMNILYKA
jgi:hypothetical protein